MKRLFTLLLALAMILSMVACTTTTGSTDTTDTSDTTAATDTTEASATEDTSATESEPIKIGWYGPLSGSAASVGVCGETAVKLAISQINEAGGVLGRQIELYEYDDEGTAENSVKVVTRLVEENGVVAIVGSHLSGSVLATTDITEAAHVVQVGCGTSKIWTNIGLQYTFRGTVNSALFVDGCYEAMVKMGATKVALICAETEYSQTATDSLASLIEAGGAMEIVDREECTTGDTDYSGQIIKMLAAEPDGVWVVAGGEDVGKIVKQLRMKGYDGYIYGIEPFADKQLKEIAGEYADNVIFSCCYFVPDSIDDALSDAEKDFLTAYYDMYEKLPDSEVAYRAYDAMNILAQAIEIAGSTDGDAIRDAILTNTFTGIAGTFDFSDGSGDGIMFGTNYIIVDGKTIKLDDYQG